MRVLWIVSVCACVLPVTATSAHADTNAPLNVFVSILPQKYLVERIGGEHVDVQVMVRPGLNPETYEPTPKQMASLNRADVYFRIAVPFEELWIDKIRALNPALRIVECCGELEIADPAPFDPVTGNNKHQSVDAHVWTSPDNAKVLAQIISTALAETDPQYSNDYQNNFETLTSDLDALDQFIRQELSAANNRYLLVAHPSWGHFANEYGLTQVAIERHGTEVRAKELVRLIEFAKANRIQNVYVQKQFDSPSARMLAREINAQVVELDPLAEDYIANLRQVTLAISAGESRK